MSIFTKNLMPRVKSSMFGLTHTNTLTLDMPFLTPVLCRDVLPGDKWQISSEVLLQMSPMLAPMYGEVDVFVHYFYVPLRLLVHDYDSFFNPEEQENVYRPFIDPTHLASYISSYGIEYVPIDQTNWDAGDVDDIKAVLSLCSLMTESSLADYLGIPVLTMSDYIVQGEGEGKTPQYDSYDIGAFLTALANIPKFSAIPFLMYQLIYDSYYRDQTLEDAVLDDLETYANGFEFGKLDINTPFSDTGQTALIKLMTLRTRAWRKDYFTSALPTPQAGPDVHLPLTGDANVLLDTDAIEAGKQQLVITSDDISTASANRGIRVGGSSPTGGFLGAGNTPTPSNIDPNGTLKADLSGVTSATINELRRAVRAQEFLEKCARGGRRYIEMILSHFGVHSSDGRLDRPEFLGGGRQPFSITPVLSHVGESDDSNFVLGEMAGYGKSYGSSSRSRRYFEEHGYIFAILSVLPKASYQQGLERHWTRETLFDYAWPSFANLGEQEIKNKEIFAQSDTPDGVFGYAPRYSEYKYIPSTVHGAMRSSLAYWHLGRIFSTAPALNASFVHPDPEELKRIFAVQDGETNSIYGVVKHHIQCRRRLPKYGIPSL